jgi:hypothetical protein
MKLNLNAEVLVEIRPRGVVLFDNYYRNLELDPEKYHKHWRQPDGRYKMPLWEVAHIFGQDMMMGVDPPIATTIEVLR